MSNNISQGLQVHKILFEGAPAHGYLFFVIKIICLENIPKAYFFPLYEIAMTSLDSPWMHVPVRVSLFVIPPQWLAGCIDHWVWHLKSLLCPRAFLTTGADYVGFSFVIFLFNTTTKKITIVKTV